MKKLKFTASLISLHRLCLLLPILCLGLTNACFGQNNCTWVLKSDESWPSPGGSYCIPKNSQGTCEVISGTTKIKYSWTSGCYAGWPYWISPSQVNQELPSCAPAPDCTGCKWYCGDRDPLIFTTNKWTYELQCPCTDNDHDGFYKYATSCPQGNDCDDGNAAINPNTIWYKDADNDGYTDNTKNGPQCQRPTGYKLSSELASSTTDCDDNDANKTPADKDGDGYTGCGGDCNDSNRDINPGTIWYKDADNDGYTDNAKMGPQCQRPTGYKLASELKSTTQLDCNDNNANLNPIHPCCPTIDSFTGSSVTINPISGGNITFNASVSNPVSQPFSWTLDIKQNIVIRILGSNLSIPVTIKSITGSGTLVPDIIWNGKDSNNKVVVPGTYKAKLNIAQGSCTAQKETNFTVTSSNQCQLNVNFGSTANVASGNLHHSQTLFSTAKQTFDLHYNSSYGEDGPLVKGWSHIYDIGLIEFEDGTITFRDGNGSYRVYQLAGSTYTNQPGDYSTLTKSPEGTFTIINKDGTIYNFNNINKVSSITDRNGSATTFAYSADGDLISIIDSAGRATTLSYNANHRIAAINDPNGNIHSFTYSGNDLIGVSTQPGGSQSATTSWSYTYYENSFMKTKTDPNGYTTTYTYDDDHRVAASTDPEGNVKSVTYPIPDDASQSKTTTVTEKDGGVWTYAYDTQAGTLTSKTDPENGTTSYIYDANRNMTSKTEADGSVTSDTYDAQGNMTSTTDALNQTTSYTYNSYGQVTSITAPDSTTTTYEYDAKGNLTQIKDSAGQITTYSYDSRGNVTSITNAQGQTTKFTYDSNNNLASTTDPTGATTSFTYDTAGNMTSQTDASGNTTRFEYDSLNHLIKVIDPNGNSTINTYDKNGNKTSSTDANGNITYYEYNYKGQLTKVKDALGSVTIYTYGGTGCASCGDGADKLTVITDANGNATKYEYDTLGRLTKETDPLGNAISYSYDSKGNLISKTDANGATISYSYDSLGRLLKKSYPDNTTESFKYDSKGSILTATNSNISYTLSYNANSKVTSVTDSNGRAVSYQYDSLGNKTKLTYPEGSVVSYSYDKANRLSSMVNGGGKTYTFTYDSLGRRSKLSLPNGASANYSYDSSGRLTSLTHKTSSNSTIASFTYTHDNVGNRLTKALDTGTNYTYSYDAIYRLTEALSSTPGYSSNTTSKGSGTTTATQQQKEYFTYDLVGNRLTSDTYSTYTYNQANQLLSNGGTYSYDKNGNLTSKVDDSTTYAYSYDYENRLVKVLKTESDTTTTSEYKYDPFGRRIEKKVTESGTTTTTKYVYDNEDIILEYDGSGNVGNRYVHGPGIDEPLAVISGKNSYYYHADGLGSIVALTDSTGKVQQTYEYDSFGNLKDQKNKVKQPYTFTGREWDKEAGLYYLRARFYDPKVARFISKDPIGFEGGDMNLYSYVKNNPIIAIDPSGLELISLQEGLKIIAAGEKYIGTPYSQMDCSHFVNRAYNDAGFLYSYSTTQLFDKNLKFKKVSNCQAGDVTLFSGHMGIYNPNPPKSGYNILSATTSKGVIYGDATWFGSYSCYRYDKCPNN